MLKRIQFLTILLGIVVSQQLCERNSRTFIKFVQGVHVIIIVRVTDLLLSTIAKPSNQPDMLLRSTAAEVLNGDRRCLMYSVFESLRRVILVFLHASSDTSLLSVKKKTPLHGNRLRVSSPASCTASFRMFVAVVMISVLT